MKIALPALLGAVACICLCIAPLHAAEPPRIQMVNGTGQLIVNGHPFLILGGELARAYQDRIIVKCRLSQRRLTGSRDLRD